MKADLWELIRRNYQDLYRFAYRMIGNHEIAEDIVQESFLRMARKNPKAPDRESARRWLFVVTRNLCISQLRQDFRHGKVTLDAASKVEALSANPAESALTSERSEWVKKAVSALPPLLREVLILREYESLRYAEIAAVLHCPVGTVKSRLATAREEMRKHLQPLMEIES